MAKTIDVIVIGGGVIGLATARAAAARGAQVMLLEADRIGSGSSYANAGLVVPGFSLPLADPEAIKGLPDLLWGENRSLKLKLRFDSGLLRWTLRFLAASRREAMLATASALSRLAGYSLAEMEDSNAGDQFEFKRKGWLHLYQTSKGLDFGRREAEMLRRIGMTVEELGPSETRELEPELTGDLQGSLYYSQEAQVEPYRFCQWLAQDAVDQGVQIIEQSPVQGFLVEGPRIKGVRLEGDQIQAEQYVVAAGAWSGPLLKPLIGWLPMEPAKGYSLTYPLVETKPNRPLMWVEKHVVMTPFEEKLRVTTGLDLVGFDDGVAGAVVAKLDSVASAWVGGKGAQRKPEEWFGYRPLTPDGLPIMGPTRRYRNLFVATGHGQLGVTLALGTGDLLAAQLADEVPPLEAAPFAPSRVGL